MNSVFDSSDQSGTSANTIDKALTLLEFFSLNQTRWGLSELARAAGYDKATTLRLLRALIRHQMIEQHAETRKYQLGTAFLTLARVREASFPLATILQEKMRWLAEITGETAHAALGGDAFLRTVAVVEPARATRVHLDPADKLPFHATASGIIFMAFGPASAYRGVEREIGLPAFTGYTPTCKEVVSGLIEGARESGFAIANQTFEDETIGIATPFFDDSGVARGAIAVASPALRVDAVAKTRIIDALFTATRDVTKSLGGSIPDLFTLDPSK